MAVLVIADHDNRCIRAATLNALSAARQIDPEVHILVAGHNAGDVAAKLAHFSGVSKVFHADHPGLEAALAESLCAQVLSHIARQEEKYSHILLPATSSGKNVAPRIAAMLDVAPISEITGVIAGDTFERPIYAGNAVATVRSRDAIKVLTVRATAFPLAQAGDVAARVEKIAVDDIGCNTRFIERKVSESDRPELASAKFVVSGGRALSSAENFDAIIKPLADKLGAAIGASRAAVDAGYAPNDLQVGQTGKIVAPKLYLAVGISGAIQHIAGMKDSGVIIAINKDPEAPIFGIADIGLEADLFTVIPQITEAL